MTLTDVRPSDRDGPATGEVGTPLSGIFELGRFLLFPDADFADRKFKDHQAFTVVTLLVTGVCLAALWLWDMGTDPAGAVHTVALRCLFVPILFAVAWLIYSGKYRRVRSLLLVGALLAAECIFVEILNRLNMGMTYGLAGFMYCSIFSIAMFQCFSLSVNFAYTLTSVSLPHFLGITGFAHNFPHAQYAILLWPAAAMALLVQTAMAQNYLARYKSRQMLELLSNTDPMTNTSNRRHFMPLCQGAVRQARRLRYPVSLLSLDIDHFKRINDTYGHPTGDLVIRRLADICRQAARRQSDVVARLGGEEFGILLPGTGLAQAVAIAELIRARVETTSVQGFDHADIDFTVSLGVTELCREDTGEEDLFRRADKALYEAKANGRNRVVGVT
jgi:diguanylate cyclase (GGDEF)-like protein